MARIMIVEDDRVIALQVKKHLEDWAHQVSIAEDLADIIPQAQEEQPELYLMDIALPYFSGYYWCERIRSFSDAPIIFISSASSPINIVMAVNMGGDDFISKPFDMDVLTAKVQAVLRRAYQSKSANVIEAGGVVLMISEQKLSYKDNEIELTKNEFRILTKLMQNKGSIVSREELCLSLWQTDCYVDDNTLSVNVNRLRKKLADSGLNDFIKTRKGSGYIVEGKHE